MDATTHGETPCGAGNACADRAGEMHRAPGQFDASVAPLVGVAPGPATINCYANTGEKIAVSARAVRTYSSVQGPSSLGDSEEK
jgi:hypothetical protein